LDENTIYELSTVIEPPLSANNSAESQESGSSKSGGFGTLLSALKSSKKSSRVPSKKGSKNNSGGSDSNENSRGPSRRDSTISRGVESNSSVEEQSPAESKKERELKLAKIFGENYDYNSYQSTVDMLNMPTKKMDLLDDIDIEVPNNNNNNNNNPSRNIPKNSGGLDKGKIKKSASFSPSTKLIKDGWM
jgi:hypothetical protein